MLDDFTEAADEAQDDTVRERLVFRIGEMLIAIPVLYVREILDRTPCLPLPRAPHYVLGMIDVRSRSIAVLDFAAKLGCDALREHEGSRIVVLDLLQGRTGREAGAAADGGGLLAILTDGVVSVAELDEARSEGVPAVGEQWDDAFIVGLARLNGEVVIEVDLAQIFVDEPDLLFRARA